MKNTLTKPQSQARAKLLAAMIIHKNESTKLHAGTGSISASIAAANVVRNAEDKFIKTMLPPRKKWEAIIENESQP